MFAILRTKKVKSDDVRKAQEHNLRIRHAYNVEKSRSYLNEILIDEFDIATHRNLPKALDDYYKNKNTTRRKNSVEMMEFVLTASPQFFKNIDKKKMEDWKNSQLEFAKNKWGDSVKLAILHMDETSPHIHIMISTEHTTTKKYKNQFGEFYKETTSLNVKRFDRDYLKQLQTDYAEHNKRFNLNRGLHNSKTVHKSLKDFYKEIERSKKRDYTKDIMTYFDTLKSNFFGVVSVKTVIEQMFPMVEKIVKQNKTYKSFIDNYSKNVSFINRQIEENKKKEEEIDKIKIDLKEKDRILTIRKERYNKAINEQDLNLKSIEFLKVENKKLQDENEKLKNKNQNNLDISAKKLGLR